MCGIFAIVNDKTNQAAQTTLEGLKRLEYRGYDSWGVAVVSGKSSEVFVEKHIGKIGQANTSLPGGTLAIGHTRWATHGGVTELNAHPHLDCQRRFVVIHNGIVENYQELREELKRKKHQFKSETDTEIIAHLLEEKSEKETTEKAVFSVFKMLVGSNAIVVLDSQNGTIIACRNGSPLVAGLGIGQYFLASDVTAFLKYTKDVHFLDDGEAVVLKKSGLTLYDLFSEKEKVLHFQHLDWESQDAEKGGYSHFILKEIMEQKMTIPKTVLINQKEMEKISQKIKKEKNKIVFLACGTAAYCGLAAKYYFSQVGLEAETYGAYEFLPFSQFLNSKTVVFAISQSGETADTLIAAKKAKTMGAYLVAVVNARGSTLERMADSVLSVGAGPEIAVVSTKSFTSQLATLYLISRMIVGKGTQARQEIKKLGSALEKWLNEKLLNKIITLAKQITDEEDMYVIGKHLNFPAALEFGLKIKESSYIHAESFAAGELKHGVITLIGKNTPCFILGANDETKLELMSSAAELKARGGSRIGIAPYNSSEFDFHLETPEVGNLTIFPNAIVGQLLGYYLGIGRGTDPDKPRNLAKSVTVK